MKSIKFLVFILFVFCSHSIQSQNNYFVSGCIPRLKNTKFILKGYHFQGDTLLSVVNANDKGEFALEYPSDYMGAAMVEYGNYSKKLLILDHENFELSDGRNREHLNFINSTGNTLVEKGIDLLEQSDSKLSALSSLYFTYKDNPTGQDFFKNEIEKINFATSYYVESFPKESYARYYVKLRKFLVDLNISTYRVLDKLAEQELFFNEIDFNDKRLVSSGFCKNLLLVYVHSLNRNRIEIDHMYLTKMIDSIVLDLKDNPKMLREVSVYLFDLLEKRGLYSSCQYLASSILYNKNCLLDTSIRSQFEKSLKRTK